MKQIIMPDPITLAPIGQLILEKLDLILKIATFPIWLTAALVRWFRIKLYLRRWIKFKNMILQYHKSNVTPEQKTRLESIFSKIQQRFQKSTYAFVEDLNYIVSQTSPNHFREIVRNHIAIFDEPLDKVSRYTRSDLSPWDLFIGQLRYRWQFTRPPRIK